MKFAIQSEIDNCLKRIVIWGEEDEKNTQKIKYLIRKYHKEKEPIEFRRREKPF